MTERDVLQTRSTFTDVKTRDSEEKDEFIIEGYFVVFDKPTELWAGAFEEIKREAFGTSEAVSELDVRALINHDTSLVLGRTKSGTLKLSVDDKGLLGSIIINENDSDAVNLYHRVKRGDVSQCSFGFNILEEDVDYQGDGTVKWTIKKLELFEVSVCTFPAYSDTGVQARKKDVEQHKKRKNEEKIMKLRERLLK